ncbi:MAG: DUF2344 domain-containing protein [Clostridia bacterium]|nr:DUF2344 domain-containing protein [Clostridia bacterium]
MRMLGVFEKNERVRHIGHLDIQRAVQRGLRRSGLPVAYSNGFNPHILVTFASALSTGAAGKREIMDVKMAEPVTEQEFLTRMNAAMPPEMQLSSARGVEDKHPALMASLKAGMYEIILREEAQAELLIPAIDKMMAQEEIQVPRKTKSGIKDVDMKPLIYALRGGGQKINATLMLTERESCKPAMIIEGLKRAAGLPEEEEVRTLVIRTQLLGERQPGELIPLEEL